MSNLLKYYQELTETLKKELKIGWAKNIQQESLEVSNQLISIEQIVTKIQQFAPSQGWLQTLDSVLIINIDDTIQTTANYPIINGELINQQGQSLHIRQQGSQLSLTLYSPIKEPDEKNEKAETLLSAKYNQLIQTKGIPNGQQATYKVYWDMQDTKQPKYSRLIRIGAK